MAPVVGLLALPLVSVGALGAGSVPSPHAVRDVPADYLALYRDAVTQRCPSLPWSVLAAIGKVESDHGRTREARTTADGAVQPPIIGVALDGTNGTARIADTDHGLFDHDTVHDRAVGPMQFIPSTWTAHGIDASGDGAADPHNAIDAIHTAAAYLCAVGAHDPTSISRAIHAYNRSWQYVARVLDNAASYAAGSTGTLPADPTLIALVLNNPRLQIYPAGRHDIAAGLIDARVLALLQRLSATHTLVISSLRSGHSRCIGGREHDGCRVSHHWHGRGVDISSVNGRPVSPTNRSARDLARALSAIDDPLRPDEIGTPWNDLDGPGYFSDAAHQDHLHLGFRARAR